MPCSLPNIKTKPIQNNSGNLSRGLEIRQQQQQKNAKSILSCGHVFPIYNYIELNSLPRCIKKLEPMNIYIIHHQAQRRKLNQQKIEKYL